MKLLGRRVRADDGVDPALGVLAHGIKCTRPGPGAYRIALTDDAEKVIGSIDLERGDIHDLRVALTHVLKAQ